MKRQENRAVIAWREAASAGLVSSADRADMKTPVPRSTPDLWAQEWIVQFTTFSGSFDTLTFPMKPTIQRSAHQKIEYDTADVV